MLVRKWAAREGVNPQTVWKWCREDTMPVSVEQTPTGMWLIHDSTYEPPSVERHKQGVTVCYVRVSSGDQKQDVTRQVDRLKAFALNVGVTQPEVVTEVGSGMNDTRCKLNKILQNPEITTIIVEHRDRLARMNVGLIESAFAAQGHKLIIVDDCELDDDLVCDMTEVLTSLCVRLYGRRSAERRVGQALKAARDA